MSRLAAEQLAAEQLADLAAVSSGAVEILGSHDHSDSTVFTISLDTAGIITAPGGIAVRARERFEVIVDSTYPFRPPTVRATHRRWARSPHVQWSNQLCLYAAPAFEWNSSDGIRGLIARLVLWLERAAAADLDPDDQPLHPPVTYSSYDNGWLVVRPDLAGHVPWDHDVHDITGNDHTTSNQATTNGRVDTLYAWCSRTGRRVDVLDWLTLAEVIDRIRQRSDDDHPDPQPGNPHDAARGTASGFVAPMVLISDTLDMEYPRDAAGLSRALERYGYPRERLLHGLVAARAVNKALAHLAAEELDVPSVVLLGTPARRVEPGRRLAHLVAWHLDALGADITNLLQTVPAGAGELTEQVRDLARRWLEFSDIDWMVVHEARPEVTRSRDSGSASLWLRGKKIAVLGCGALGAPVAEQCARAQVSQLHLIDQGVVTPGILVRQPYTDVEIGLSKARQLADRLARFQPVGTTVVTASHENVLTGVLSDPDQLLGYDLIIDATADAAVRACLEKARSSQRNRWPATVSLLLGHTAERGVVVVSRAGASGGPQDILRRVAIESSTNPPAGWRPISEDLFPDPPRSDYFLPEPGCSSPTFTGSATQTTALASALLWAALRLLGDPDAAPMTAHAVELPKPSEPAGDQPGAAILLSWPNDHIVRDDADMFEIRLSRRALGEMRTEVRRGVRVRGRHVETGGMLLGALDEATGTIHIDTATGPPPDSRLSSHFYLHGTIGTQDLVDTHRIATAARAGFIGLWHTHPHGPARPSSIDDATMSDIVAPDGAGRRALMLILGGARSTWDRWLADDAAPDLYARLARREGADTGLSGGPPAFPPMTPGARWFPGGYRYPDNYLDGEPDQNLIRVSERRSVGGSDDSEVPR